MGKHTPGPWSLQLPDYESAEAARDEWDDSPDDESLRRAAEDAAGALISARNWQAFARVFTFVSGRRDLVGEANARLIAAAPELLAACKAFAEAYRTTGDMVRAYLLAQQAIAKAEGGA